MGTSGTTIGAFPYYPNNPWQDIMYSASRARGVEVLPFDLTVGSPVLLERLRSGRQVTLHLNWTTPVAQVASSVGEALDRVRATLSHLSALRNEGARVVWTIHNVLPHETRWLGAELLLAQGLCDSADLVHVMNPDTEALTRDFYRWDESKTLRIDHPSYDGVYDDGARKVDARARFSLSADDLVVVLVGVLRPYKGLAALIDALELVPQSARIRLLIAGEVGGSYTAEQVELLLASDERIVGRVGYVPPDELQFWYRAADLSVLPFTDVLNSGSALLSASFGVPVLVSDVPATRFLESEEWVARATLGKSPGTLSAALVDAAHRFRNNESAARAAREYARSRSPVATANAFDDAVRGLEAG